MKRTEIIQIILLGSAGFLASCTGGQRSAWSSPGYELTGDSAEIVAAFERDEAAAYEKYGGRRVRIAGYLSGVEERRDGSIAVTLKTSIATFRPVKCVVDADVELHDHVTGDPINIVGEVKGFSESGYYVEVADCTVLYQ